MRSVQLFAAVSLIVICCAWRFAGDEVTRSEQFLVTYGGQQAAGRLHATKEGVVFELFDDDTQTSRGSLGLDESGVSSLTLRDGRGKARFQVVTDKDGATSLGITDGHGQTIWGVDVDARGHVKIKTKGAVTPTERQ